MSGHSGKAWEQGRQQALHRDNYQCQDCGSKEYVHAHHIKRPEEFEVYEDGHHESNLVALCKYCHPTWEGVEARPILLDDRGTNLGPVVEDLVVDHIDRLSHRMVPREIYRYFLSKNPNVCQYCWRPDGAYSSAPAEKWRSCIRVAVKFGLGSVEELTIPARRDGMGNPVEQSNPHWECEECHGIRYRRDAVKTDEFMRNCFWASEALTCQGVLHDMSVLADKCRELKTDPNRTYLEVGIMVDAVAEAVEAVEGTQQIPEWLREERY